MSSERASRSQAMVYAFGLLYAKAFDPKTELRTLLDRAISEKINYENRLSMLTWLKDDMNMSAYRYVSSVKDLDWKLLVEDFKKKTLQQGTNVETKLTTLDKSPVYDDTASGDAVTQESPSAQMAPRDPAFLTLTKQYLKGSRKQGDR